MMNSNIYYFFKINQKNYCFNCYSYDVLEVDKDILEPLAEYLEEGKYNYHKYDKDVLKKTICFINMHKSFFVDEIIFKSCFSPKKMIFSFCPVHSCNLSCVYCFARQEKNVKYNGFMQKETLDKIFEHIVNEFSEYQDYRIEFVSGGEPLLHWELIEYTVSLAKKFFYSQCKTFSILIVTNATKLSEEKISFINNNNIDLCISIDGEKYLHDLQRPMKNGNSSYDAVVQATNLISSRTDLSSRTKRMWAISVITSNCDSLKKIIENNISLGFAAMEMRLARGCKFENIFLNESNVEHFIALYKDLYEYFILCIRCKDYSKIMPILNEYDYFGRILYRLFNNSKILYRCNAGKNKIAFAANGDIYPCDSFVGNSKYLIGNIYENSFNKHIQKYFKEINVNNIKRCSGCKFKYLCSGDCYYNTEMVLGKLCDVDNSYCKLMNNMCELAIKLYTEILESDPVQFNKIKRLIIKNSLVKG